MTETFKRSIFISLFWHIAMFSIFSFTFGARVIKQNFSDVVFLGSLLSRGDFNNRAALATAPPFNSLPIKGVNKEYSQVSWEYIKPQANIAFEEVKKTIAFKASSLPAAIKKSEPVIMLYPQLPYNFLLYFKDRQSVHIELMFNRVSRGDTYNTMIKRKISSGNLEADLLSMRYIGHYLFIQQAKFPTDTWQTVKIDLSEKENK